MRICRIVFELWTKIVFGGQSKKHVLTLNYILQNENNVGELNRLKDSLKECISCDIIHNLREKKLFKGAGGGYLGYRSWKMILSA